MKTRTLLFILFYLAIAVSCERSATRWIANKTSYDDDESQNEFVFYNDDEYDYSELKIPENETVGYEPRFVKTGDLTISTDDIESTKKQVYKFVKRCKGYITEEKLVKNSSESYYKISLSIQEPNFGKFIDLIDSADLDVVSRTLTLEDVTMQYMDDSTRLANKKKLENRYLELLSKAGDMEEILKIEGKLEEIRSDIEVRTSGMKLLEKKTKFSEFNLTIEKIRKENSYIRPSSFSYKAKNAVIRGWEGIIAGILILISFWPIFLLIAILYYPGKTIAKRIKKIKIGPFRKTK